ncbi:hypothetical protein O3M35_000394 [Rhynocoris fuscipes]|uniref:Uncharacterized protein n=1 Tax=Rhynocoris fuscipes TaxID=488301 RepID=A0AAW1DNC3_9HEMI
MFVDKLSRCKLCELEQCLPSPTAASAPPSISATSLHQSTGTGISPGSPSLLHYQPPPISSYIPSLRDFMITTYYLRGSFYFIYLNLKF